MLGTMIVCIGLFHLLPVPEIRWPWWARLALLSLLLAQVSSMVNIFASSIFPVIKSIFRPGEHLREAILTPVKDELDRIITQLVTKYERRHLEYALERVSFGASQVRLGLGLTIGALDKIGLIPVVIGYVVTIDKLYPKLWNEPFLVSSQSSPWVGIGLGLVMVYLAGISLHRSLGRLDHAALAIKHAVEAKKFEEALDNRSHTKFQLNSRAIRSSTRARGLP
jgi:hypothetical protein